METNWRKVNRKAKKIVKLFKNCRTKLEKKTAALYAISICMRDDDERFYISGRNENMFTNGIIRGENNSELEYMQTFLNNIVKAYLGKLGGMVKDYRFSDYRLYKEWFSRFLNVDLYKLLRELKFQDMLYALELKWKQEEELKKFEEVRQKMKEASEMIMKN